MGGSTGVSQDSARMGYAQPGLERQQLPSTARPPTSHARTNPRVSFLDRKWMDFTEDTIQAYAEYIPTCQDTVSEARGFRQATSFGQTFASIQGVRSYMLATGCKMEADSPWDI